MTSPWSISSTSSCRRRRCRGTPPRWRPPRPYLPEPEEGLDLPRRAAAGGDQAPGRRTAVRGPPRQMYPSSEASEPSPNRLRTPLVRPTARHVGVRAAAGDVVATLPLRPSARACARCGGFRRDVGLEADDGLHAAAWRLEELVRAEQVAVVGDGDGRHVHPLQPENRSAPGPRRPASSTRSARAGGRSFPTFPANLRPLDLSGRVTRHQQGPRLVARADTSRQTRPAPERTATDPCPTRPVLVIQHTVVCPPGRVGDWLSRERLRARGRPTVRRGEPAGGPDRVRRAWWCWVGRWARTTTTSRPGCRRPGPCWPRR